MLDVCIAQPGTLHAPKALVLVSVVAAQTRGFPVGVPLQDSCAITQIPLGHKTGIGRPQSEHASFLFQFPNVHSDNREELRLSPLNRSQSIIVATMRAQSIVLPLRPVLEK